jgi:hypothetical protein
MNKSVKKSGEWASLRGIAHSAGEARPPEKSPGTSRPLKPGYRFLKFPEVYWLA